MPVENVKTRRQTVPSGRGLGAAWFSAGAVMLLTSVHHAYGAVLYGTPWRNHLVHVSIFTMLLVTGALLISAFVPRSRLGRVALWMAVVAIALIPVGMIGLFEGLYNHLLKDVLFFSGVPMPWMRHLFPSPAYEMPDDLLFEASGLLQVFVAALAAYFDYRLVRVGLGNEAAAEVPRG